MNIHQPALESNSAIDRRAATAGDEFLIRDKIMNIHQPALESNPAIENRAATAGDQSLVRDKTVNVHQWVLKLTRRLKTGRPRPEMNLSYAIKS